MWQPTSPRLVPPLTLSPWKGLWQKGTSQDVLRASSQGWSGLHSPDVASPL